MFYGGMSVDVQREASGAQEGRMPQRSDEGGEVKGKKMWQLGKLVKWDYSII